MSFFITNVYANPIACAVCTFAIASGLGVSRMLGVTDTVIGVWVGTMLFALSQWTVEWLSKKNIKNKWISVLCYLLWFATIIPLYTGEIPNIIFNANTILGIDSFIFSIISGIAVLVGSIKLYRYMKTKNGKPHFPFEKVVLPISSLIFASLIFNYFV
jgi:hypothetical protein